MLKGPMDDGKGQCITLVSVISLLSLTIVVGHALMLIIFVERSFQAVSNTTYVFCLRNGIGELY